MTRCDSYPIPHVDDCTDQMKSIGYAKYATKFDVLKGFWHVPLIARIKKISAFVMPDGLYQYIKVMPFSMKNALATFKQLIDKVILELDAQK